jgi:hypothetical protein
MQKASLCGIPCQSKRLAKMFARELPSAASELKLAERGGVKRVIRKALPAGNCEDLLNPLFRTVTLAP